jgi:hypothetical protein
MWDYAPMPLGLSKGFQVLIWREGEVEHYGAARFTRQREQRIDLDEVPQVKSGGMGTYYWTVVVVDQRTDKRISPEANPMRFTFPGPQEPGEKPPPIPRP